VTPPLVILHGALGSAAQMVPGTFAHPIERIPPGTVVELVRWLSDARADARADSLDEPPPAA
jgi:hypothetical protein